MIFSALVSVSSNIVLQEVSLVLLQSEWQVTIQWK